MTEQYGDLLDKLDLPYWELDLDLKVVFANSCMKELFGVVTGKTCSDVLLCLNDECLKCPIRQVLAGKPRITCERMARTCTAESKWIRHSALPLKDEHGAITGVRGIIVDITAYRKSEDWWKDSDRHYRALIEELPDIIFSLDPCGNFIFANTQIEHLLDYKLETILEKSFQDLVAPEHLARLETLFVLAPHAVWDEEIAVVAANGDRKITRVRCKGLYDDNGSLLEIDGVMRDRTLHKSLEEELKASKSALLEKIKIIYDLYEHIVQSGKYKAIEEHTAEVAHELRQPLAIVGGFARRLERQICSENKPDSSRQRQYLGIIISEIQRLEKILDRLVDFTKRSTIAKRMVDPNELIQYIIGITQSRLSEKNLDLIANLGSEVGDIPMDPGRFQQLVLNLMTNAIEASPIGGKIHLTTGLSIPSDKALKVGQFGVNGFFEMKLRNNGPAIPPEALKNVFNPFFTTKQQGTGLGLTVCKKIVEDHSGSISVKSDDQGTVFTIWLPLSNVTGNGK